MYFIEISQQMYIIWYALDNESTIAFNSVIQILNVFYREQN